MSYILRPQRWRRQPRYAVALNYNHPLLANFAFVWNPAVALDRAEWGDITGTASVSSAVRAYTQRGNVAFDTDIAGTQYVKLSVPQPGGSTPWTLATLAQPSFATSGTTLPPFEMTGYNNDGGSPTRDRSIGVSASTWNAYIYDQPVATGIVSDSGVTALAGREDVVIATATGSTLLCSANGVDGTLRTGLFSSGFSSYTTPCFLVGNAGPSPSNTGAAISLVVLTHRAWSLEERLAFNENPWQIYKPTQRRVFVIPAATTPVAVGNFSKRRTQQPRSQVELDLSHPFIRSPQLCVNLYGGGTSATNLVAGGMSTLVSPSNISKALTPHGVGNTFAGNTQAALQWPNPITTYTKVTFAAVFRWDSGAANNFPQLMGTSSVNSGLRVGATGSTGDLGLVKGGVIALNTIALNSGEMYFMVCSHDQASGDYYITARSLDTGAIVSATQTETSVSVFGDGVFSVGNARQDFSGAWNGAVLMAYASSDYLPRHLADAWLQNPWQVFRPQRRHLISAASIGGGTIYNISGSDSLSAAGTEHFTASIGISKSEALTATGAEHFTASLGISKSDALTATSTEHFSGSGSISNSDSLTATDTEHFTASLGISKSDALTATSVEHFAAVFIQSRTDALTATSVEHITAFTGANISTTDSLSASDVAHFTASMGISRQESAAASDTAHLIAAIGISQAGAAAASDIAHILAIMNIHRNDALTAADFESMSVRGLLTPTYLALLSPTARNRLLRKIAEARIMALQAKNRTLN